MLYALYIIGFNLAAVLPVRASYALAAFIVRIYYMLASGDKRALRKNLRVVLGEDVPDEELEKHVWGVFKNFAKYLVDFFKFPCFTQTGMTEDIQVRGQENLDKCLEKGKGIIVVSLHLGNWELGGAVVGALGYPVSAIVLEHQSKRINSFFVNQRALNDVRSIPIGTQMKECFRVLRQNELLAIAADKDYTSTGIPVDFFGRTAIMPKGPAIFSLKTGAPIVVTAMIRRPDDTFLMKFEEPIEYVPSGDREKDVRVLMGKYIRIFEEYIREYPDQWYVFREVWKQE